MRLLVTLIVVGAVGFISVMGFYWWREGSLEGAGAQMDDNVEALGRSTKDLRDEVGDVGKEAVETIEKTTDGDDRT